MEISSVPEKVSRIKHARCEGLEMTGEKSECVIVAKKLGDEEVWRQMEWWHPSDCRR
jgi:hypothetical protein